MLDIIKLDNVEAGILADFLRHQSRAGADVEIEHGEDGTLYFTGAQGQTCEITSDGTALLSENWH